MKSFLSYAFIFCSYSFFYAQDLPYTFKNDFDDPLLNIQEIVTAYSKAYYQNGNEVFELTNESQAFFNTDYAVIAGDREFIIETEINCAFKKFATGKAGLCWGFANNKNTNVFLLNESGQYQVYFVEKGTRYAMQGFNSSGLSPEELLGKIKVRVHQHDSVVDFSLNNKKIFSCPAMKIYGNRVGFLVGTDVRVNYLYVKQKTEKIAVADNAKQFTSKERCDAGLEGRYNELKPLVSHDGKSLYFMAIETGGQLRDKPVGRQLYKVTLNSEGQWLNRITLSDPLPDVSSLSLVSISSDESLIIAAAQKGNDSLKRSYYEVKWYGSSCYPPKKLFSLDANGLNIISECLSEDKRFLFLSAERENVQPLNADIYMCRRTGDSSWTSPVLLDSLSSAGDELSPFLFYDNSTLYFSSYGFVGSGRADVFVSKRLDDTWTKWSKPQNAGAVINGKAWDGYFFIPAKGEYAWMSSTSGFYNNLDIHKVKMNVKKEWLVKGRVLNSVTNAVQAGAKVRVINLATKKAIDSIIVGKDGAYFFLKIKPGQFLLEAESGILHNDIRLSVMENCTEYNYDITLTPPGEGSVIVLKHISFEPNKFDILSSSFSELDKLAKYLQENKDLKIEIHGHTSMNSEGERFNRDLSSHRAAAVKEYLVDKGIKSERIIYMGFGFTEPLYKGDDPDQQSLNRRVEILFLKEEK